MPPGLTGINNENQYYCHHYLSAIVETFSQWREMEDAYSGPWNALNGVMRITSLGILRTKFTEGIKQWKQFVKFKR